jgi:adhesin/invasin
VQTGLLQTLAAPMSVATGGRLAVNLQVIPTRLPSIFFGGVANGSSGNAGTYSTTITNAVAPGSFVSIYGEDLAVQTAQASSATLPTTLGGVTVLVNGVAAPLFFVSPGQINFQLPFGIATPIATVVVRSQGGSSSIAWIRVALAAPGITVFGQNRAAVRNEDTSVNLPINGAAVGSVISIYGTGIGPVSPAVGSGLPASLTELTRATLNVTATIGRASAPVQFAGLTPGSTALAQVNVTVPNLPPGDYPVTITVGGVVSNGPTITVK